MIIRNHTFGPLRPSKLALMGIRFAVGEDGGAPGTPAVPATPPVAPVEPVVPATPAEPVVPKPGPPAEPEPIEGSADGGKTFDLAYVEKLRKENAKNRTDDKAAIATQITDALAAGKTDWANALGKQLGIVKDAAALTPDQIIAALTEERDTFKTERDQFASERSTRAERDAIEGASTANQGDFAMVRAVLISEGSLKDIDPTATDYEAQVAAVVKSEIEKNPKLRAVQVAPSSGGAPPSGTPAPGPLSIDERRKAIRENRASN